MGFWGTLFEIALLLAAAMALGVVFERLRQSALLGYLFAGTLLGPGALGVIRSPDVVNATAELGVALLLFTIGLEFSWRRLRDLGPTALGGGVLQMVATAALVAVAALALGLPGRPALAMGILIAPSSTACVLRVLVDRAELESVHGRTSVGILLLQDLAIVPLVLLVTMLGAPGGLGQAVLTMARAGGLFGLLVLVFYAVCRFLLPRLLDAAALSRNRELPILLAGTICLAAAWSAHALGISPALGAFVAGTLLAESPFATQIRADVGVLRTLFVTLFFCSIGMLADLAWLVPHVHQVAALVLAMAVAKAGVVWVVGRFFHLPHRHALAAGICLAQVGEFSFILAQIALSHSVLSADTFRLFVTATVASLFVTPYLVAAAPRWAERLTDALAARGWLKHDVVAPPQASEALAGHVIVIGFGPAGREAAAAVRREGMSVVVVELNPRTVADAAAHGVLTQLGDAARDEVLDHAQVNTARAVLVTIPDHHTAESVIAKVRARVPGLPVVVRARYHQYASRLEQAGASVVVDEERQIGRLLGCEAIQWIRGQAT